MGMPAQNILIADIGNCIELTEKSIAFGENIPAGTRLIDGEGVEDYGSSELMKARMKLSSEGVCAVSLAMTGNYLVGEPVFEAHGCVFAADDTEKDTGTISGYFSTYDRIPDSYGDVIAPGAFTDTIKAREESGHPFPLCWNHDLDQIIGKVDSIEDTEKGPLMTASFFDTPLAQEKREIVKSGVVYQFSFAYDIQDAKQVTLKDGRKANELRKLDLFEVSIVPIPANQNAVMTDVKAGKRNRKSDEDTIKEIISLANSLLDEVDDTENPNNGEDEPKANGAPEEQKASNPDKDRVLKMINRIKNQEV
jgi:HK97 family phage prohead protease